MKTSHYTMRPVRFLGVLWLLLPLSIMPSMVPIDFDDISAKTPYNKALRSTIGICHDLASLKDGAVSCDLQALLVDAILGKATRLVASVKDIVADKVHNTIVTDDGSYLLALIMHLEQVLNNHALCIESYPLIRESKEHLMEYCLHGVA